MAAWHSNWVTYPLFAAYLLSLALLFVYGLNCYVLILTHAAGRRRYRAPEPFPPAGPRPSVTVQLPVFNERYVARRVIEAAGRLRWPVDRLDIQVLDDSTDDTVAICADAVAALRAAGIDALHIRRGERTGFKAGALAEGLRRARGEFIAVFDADFVPPADFLERTVPAFRDSRVAVVQTRWGHLNRDYSVLTGAQALGIDGHFGVEQGARDWGGLFLNFNGTAGVWRTAAIADAGGWTHDTLTEDLDLSYRAQLRGWKIRFLPDVICPAELPVQISAFKAQQRRWATGTIQTTVKLAPAILAAPLSPWTKLQALLHTTHYLVHPLMLVVVLLSVPLAFVGTLFYSWGNVALIATLFALSTSGPTNLYVYGERQLGPGWLRRLRYLPFMMLLGIGIALSNTRAVWHGLSRTPREFVRTPKFGIGAAGGSWREKAYRMRGAWEGVAEVALGAYAGLGLVLYLDSARYLILPFLVIYTLGFAWVGVLTMLQALLAGSAVRRTAPALSVPTCPGSVRPEEPAPRAVRLLRTPDADPAADLPPERRDRGPAAAGPPRPAAARGRAGDGAGGGGPDGDGAGVESLARRAGGRAGRA